MTPIQPLTQQTVSALMALADQPNLSLYMPTHRTFPERTQDPIRLKNLFKALETSLQQRYPQLQKDTVLAPIQALIDDAAFWNNCPDGIAIFAGQAHFKVVGLHQPVEEVAIVNSHPYLKPLLRLAPLADRYQVLCLSRDSVSVHEGSTQRLHAVELPDSVPTNLVEALGDELTSRDQQGHPDGFSGGGERGDPMMHESGGGGKQDEINLDRERFFRIVDKQITEHCSRVTKLPLILAALPENQAVFRALSRNPLLMAEGVEVDPATLSSAQLASACGELMSIRHGKKLDEAFNRYGVAVGQQLAGDQLPAIARAAVEGRVALLLVAAEQRVAGTMDLSSGEVVLHEDGNPATEDVLDELILAVIRHGGEVVVVPPERVMPTDSGVAAVYRY